MMVIATETLLGTGGVALALLVLTFCMWRYNVQRWLQWFFSAGAGFVLASVLLFLLPSVYDVNIQSAFFVVLGVMAVPVLHLVLIERQSDTKKVRHPLSGLLSWARVGILALVYGDATALLGTNT
ncbi:MAG: hypothetical protein AABY13_05810, partial [Nanoarchaeota archaeon]